MGMIDLHGTVVVVGDVMLDIYITGDATRLSPEAPVPVVNVQSRKQTLGGAGNVALNLANLGCRTHLFGTRGNDVAGMDILSILQQHQIDATMYVSSTLPTTTKTRVIANNQQLVRFDDERLNGNGCHRYLRAALEEWIPMAGVVVLSDYGKGVLAHDLDQFAINLANQYEVPTLIDPKRSNWMGYRDATIITPNIPELEIASGGKKCEDDCTVLDCAEALRQSYNLKAVVVTRGAKGMLVTKEDEHVFIPTVAQSVFDVSGAGDTVIATMAACLCSGHSVVDSAQIANIAAGVVVGKLGTSPIELEELNQSLVGTEYENC